MKHTIHSYLDKYNSLCPSDNDVGASVVASEWWSPLKELFDSLLWLYYDSRQIFINPKFDPEDEDKTKNNIIKTFAIVLKSKRPVFDRMYDVLTKEYNPIWNVDGVTGTIWQDEHTGTDITTHTGTDTNVTSGSDVNRLSGSDAVIQSGTDSKQSSGADSVADHITKDDTTRTGSVSGVTGGTDINSHGVFTFDDTSESKPSAIDSTEYGKTDTTTYNTLKDAHQLDESTTTTYGKIDAMTYGKRDTTNYGKVDTTTFGKQDQMTHNTSDNNVINRSDKHIEMVIRQGNQGVTMTQAMIQSEMEVREKYGDFFKYVVHLCVNEVSFGVKGV